MQCGGTWFPCAPAERVCAAAEASLIHGGGQPRWEFPASLASARTKRCARKNQTPDRESRRKLGTEHALCRKERHLVSSVIDPNFPYAGASRGFLLAIGLYNLLDAGINRGPRASLRLLQAGSRGICHADAHRMESGEGTFAYKPRAAIRRTAYSISARLSQPHPHFVASQYVGTLCSVGNE